jgi:hypothetical protein
LEEDDSLQEAEETFITKLSQQTDDMQEFALLTEYLGFAQTPLEVGKLPDELQDVLTYMEGEENQRAVLESYALSTVIQLVNPQQQPNKPTL